MIWLWIDSIFNIGRHTFRAARVHNRSFARGVFKLYLAFLLMMAILFFFNAVRPLGFNLIWMNWVILIAGLGWVIATAANPATTLAAGVVNALLEMVRFRNPIPGMRDGIDFWITRGIASVILSWLTLCLFMATWSFHSAPAKFLPFAVASMTLPFLMIAYAETKGRTLYHIIRLYCTGLIVLSLANTIWPQHYFSAPDAYDLNTGQTQWMQNPDTGKAFKHLTPSQCRSGCFDPDTGTRLVPFDAARTTNSGTWTRRPGGPLLPVPVHTYRGSGQAAPATAVPTHPVGAPTSITVPKCGRDWSEEVMMHAGWSMTPAWQRSIAKPNFREGANGWSENYVNSRAVTAARYCAQEDYWADKQMPLTWERG